MTKSMWWKNASIPPNLSTHPTRESSTNVLWPTLAQCALVGSAYVYIPVGPFSKNIGTVGESFGVKGKNGIESRVASASVIVEAHDDNLGDSNADDVHIRIPARLPVIFSDKNDTAVHG
jgi:hypothetical protein